MAHARTVFTLILILLAFVVPSVCNAQGTVTGAETTVSYTGLNASLVPPNTPATNFASPAGLNTFILPLSNPNVAIRIYLTNNTANACVGAFTVTMWSASDPQVTSFNNSSANWQVVPLQGIGATGLVLSAPINIGASSASYITSTAIASPKVAIQIVNTTAACATTNLEATAVLAQISLTSPLVSTSSNTNFSAGGLSSNVQGVVANGVSGGTVNPVINGGLEPATNTQFLSTGLDNTASGGATVTAPGNYNLVSVPATQQSGEFALVWGFCTALNSGVTNVSAIWTQPQGTCGNTARVFTLANASTGALFTVNTTGSAATGSGQSMAVAMTFPAGTTVTGNNNAGGAGPGSIAGVVSGEAVMVAYEFQVLPCAINGVTGVRGSTYVQAAAFIKSQPSGGGGSCILVFYATNPATSSGTETFSLGGVTGTIASWSTVRLAGFSTISPTQPALATAVDTNGNQIIRLDAQAPNQFVCSVVLSTNTTTQCQPVPTTINTVPIRIYVTDIQINTTVAGVSTTLAIVSGSGTNCATGLAPLSAINFVDTAIGIQSFLGFRTPFVSPLQSAVCITQAGTTAGTSTVELHGFLAP
jgi:hypothetical protein